MASVAVYYIFVGLWKVSIGLHGRTVSFYLDTKNCALKSWNISEVLELTTPNTRVSVHHFNKECPESAESCACVCVYKGYLCASVSPPHTHTHTHTYTYIDMCLCVCLCAYICFKASGGDKWRLPASSRSAHRPGKNVNYTATQFANGQKSRSRAAAKGLPWIAFYAKSNFSFIRIKAGIVLPVILKIFPSTIAQGTDWLTYWIAPKTQRGHVKHFPARIL